MKKTKRLTLIAAMMLLSCNEESKTFSDGSHKSLSNMLNKCKGVTVVIATGHEDGKYDSQSTTVVVLDSTGKSYTCHIGGDLGLSIGDTLKK